MNNNMSQQAPIQSTAGAVPVKNDKGEVSMQKVKVQRYVSGKRPEYAPEFSSEEESEGEDFVEQQRPDRVKSSCYVGTHIISSSSSKYKNKEEKMEVEDEQEDDDPRLRRLKAAQKGPDFDDEERLAEISNRHTLEPEILEETVVEEEEEEPDRRRIGDTDSSEEEEEELDEEEIELRRKLLRQKLMAKTEGDKEFLEKEEEGCAPQAIEDSDAEDDDAEDEDYTDSDEDAGPRLKPVFVRAKDRLTVIEREKAAQKQKQTDAEAKREKDEKRREALRLVEEAVKREMQEKQKLEPDSNINDVCTDDENDEVEYEAWKLREMKRIKRDKEERENLEREAIEIERLRNMTEEERRLEQKLNPKVVTNKASKGKYKFLQKYFHRGAFYLDKDEEVLKQDFSVPTLDDHFNKSILPKVMQVKKFGRSGRTKYTHLVDQDTTKFDSPWAAESLGPNGRLQSNARVGTKQLFIKPSLKRVHK